MRRFMGGDAGIYRTRPACFCRQLDHLPQGLGRRVYRRRQFCNHPSGVGRIGFDVDRWRPGKKRRQKAPRLVDIGRHAFSLCGNFFVCLHQPEYRCWGIDPFWRGAGHHDSIRTLARRASPPVGMVRVSDRLIWSHLFVAAGMESAVTVGRFFNDDGRHCLGRLLPPRPGRYQSDCCHCRQLPALRSLGLSTTAQFQDFANLTVDNANRLYGSTVSNAVIQAWSGVGITVAPILAWKNNKSVLSTYTSPHSMSAWAYIQDVGWRKVQTLTPEGVTNMFTLLVDAQAFNKKVNVYVDGSLIYQAYCE